MALYINGNKASGGTDIVHLTQAQYDALPSSKNYDGKVYMITDTNGDGSQFQPVIYSEDEREIGVWIDGKPLYEKTIDQTINSDSDYVIFSSGIDHAYLVNSKFEYATNRWMSSDYSSNSSVSNSIFCYAEVNNGALNFHNQSNNSRHWIATIRYTKTTDTAGSGTWTPQGVPAVHYSIDEQVVGTWIDGKTVYQKTYSLQNPITIHNEDNLTSYIDIFSNISNIVGFFATSDVYKTYAPITVIVDSGQLLAIVSSTLGNINALTIQYTKTQGGA